MTDNTPVSADELIPALVELASIQHDLLIQLQRAERLDASSGPSVKAPLVAAPSLEPFAKLIARSRVLLTWLLSKTE